jgi:predicted dinucleotide-binding enzyme
VAAAQRSDVIAIAVPWTVAESVVAGLGDLSGKIVVDCTNPLAFADGALSLDRGYTTSGAETLAALVPAARVVKSLNQAGFEIMADPSRLTQRPAMFVAGDDEDAKIAVMALVSDLGFEAFDAGALRMARLLEPLAMVWINQAIFRGLGRQWAFGVVRPL